MKATGIVRRIDDLGRIVIPKELRRSLLIRVGDPLEIFISDTGEVIFKKYSPLAGLCDTAECWAEILNRTAGLCAAVTDCDYIAAAGGPLKKQKGMRLSEKYIETISSRRIFTAQGGSTLPLCAGCDIAVCAAVPILCGGDLIGSIALAGKSPDASSLLLLKTAAAYISRQLEE